MTLTEVRNHLIACNPGLSAKFAVSNLDRLKFWLLFYFIYLLSFIYLFIGISANNTLAVNILRSSYHEFGSLKDCYTMQSFVQAVS